MSKKSQEYEIDVIETKSGFIAGVIEMEDNEDDFCEDSVFTSVPCQSQHEALCLAQRWIDEQRERLEASCK